MIDTADTNECRIAWIGTGVMGLPMCEHLKKAGYSVKAYSRTLAKAEPLKEKGVQVVDDIAEAIEGVDVIFTMVGYPEDVRSVYFEGIFPHLKSGTILIDMTTTQPVLAEEIATKAAELECASLDAPVSGGDVGARNATLSIMVGGERATFDQALPLLKLLGKQIVYQGRAGCGQHTKMCNQIVIASTMVGVCESLLYGSRAGLDLDLMLTSISGGAAGCWTLDNLAPRILKRNFDPGFFVDHFVKDMLIAIEEAKRMNLDLPGLDKAYELYRKVQDLGHGALGTHALMLAMEAAHRGDQPT